MKITIIQPVVPAYRRGYFNRLHEVFGRQFSVFASHTDMAGLTEEKSLETWEHRLGPYRNIAPGLQWQSGALAIPIKRGDIIVVSGAPRCLSNLALLLKAKMKGATTVWWGLYWQPMEAISPGKSAKQQMVTYRPGIKKKLRASLRMILMKLSDYVLFYTDLEKQEYMQKYGRSWQSRIFALNNGVDTRQVVTLRVPYIPDNRGNKLFFIGRLTEKPRLDLLLHALADHRCSSVECDIVGSGVMEGPLRELAKELGLEARIRWHGATTDEQKISTVANQCSLFIHPGVVGLSLIHGLSYGLPAIVHGNRWNHGPEIAALLAGENGFVFEEGDSQSLAATITEAFSDKTRLTKMSQKAIDTTENAFNTEAMVERFTEAIATIEEQNNVNLTADESRNSKNSEKTL